MRHRIVITVEKGGKVTSRVEGIPGPACGAVSKWLDNLGTVAHVESTPEMFEPCYSEESEEVDEKVNTGNDW